jgi:small GTP-binding protein
LKEIILGTAGHIDHGKTSLVRALTGTDTDRLKEEKKRGITIELGFAALDLPDGRRLGVVDVPGHEKFVKNMVAGASGIDIVAMVIAADEGIMPQTREHLEICSLLGIRHGLVVLTKRDMVDEDWLDMVTEDVRDFLSESFLSEAPIIPVSSHTGEGMEELIAAISQLASLVPDIRNTTVFRGSGFHHERLWHGHHRHPHLRFREHGRYGDGLPRPHPVPGARASGSQSKRSDRRVRSENGHELSGARSFGSAERRCHCPAGRLKKHLHGGYGLSVPFQQ